MTPPCTHPLPRAPLLRPYPCPCSVLGDWGLEVRPPDDGKQPLFFHLQSLVAALPGVIVKVGGCVGW